jgi:hypothetical protein
MKNNSIPLKYTVRDIQRLLVERVISPDIRIESTIAIFARLQKQMRRLRQTYDYFLQQRGYLYGDPVKAINAVEDEIADVFILLCFFCGSLGIDFDSAIKNRILDDFTDGKFALK